MSVEFWDAFLKKGIMPMFGNMQEYMQADLQSRLARQRHKQSMEELSETYRMRGAEIERTHDLDVDILDRRKAFAEFEDKITRNQMLLKSSHEIGTAEKLSKIRMSEVAYEEGVKSDYQIKGYQAMHNILRDTKEKDPEKFGQLILASINDSAKTMESYVAQEQAIDSGLKRWSDTKAAIDATPDEKALADKQIQAYQAQKTRLNSYRDIMDRQIKAFALQGATTEGMVPEDKKALLQRHTQILSDKMQYRKMDIKSLAPQELVGAIQASMQEEGTPFDFDKATLQYLLTNFSSEPGALDELFKLYRAHKQKGR